MNKLEKIIDQLRLSAAEYGKHGGGIYDELAEELAELNKTHVLTPRTPTQEDVERAARSLHAEGWRQLHSTPSNWDEVAEGNKAVWRAQAFAAWAAIVGEGTSGSTDKAGGNHE